jgi:hypothetical protein
VAWESITAHVPTRSFHLGASRPPTREEGQTSQPTMQLRRAREEISPKGHTNRESSTSTGHVTLAVFHGAEMADVSLRTP